MRKNYKKLYVLLAMSLVLTACNKSENSNENANSATEEVAENSTASDDSIDIKNTERITDTEINLSDFHGNIEISKGGEYHVSGNLSEGLLYIKTEEPVTLNLDNASIESPEGPAVYVRKAESVTVRLSEGSKNTLSDIADTKYETLNAVIYSKSDITFEGKGSLTIDAQYQHGIRGKDNVVITEGDYDMEAALDCIHANDDLNIDGGQLKLQSNGDECMQSETNLNINGGKLTCASAGDAIRSEESLVVNDGRIEVTQATEGLESKNTLEINGGELKITCSDDSINGANAVTVNDGTIVAYSTTNDVLDSNGSMVINGGNIYGVGLKTPEGVFDCDHNNFEINGGTLLGLRASSSQPNKGEQPTLLVNPEITDTIETLKIKDNKGNVIYECEFNDYSKVLSEISTELQDNASVNANASTEKEDDTDFDGQTENGEQNGDVPEKGQMPEGEAPEQGTIPEGGQMPKGGEMPEKGQMPEGGEIPEGGQMPERGQKPDKEFSREELSEEELEAMREKMEERKETMGENNFHKGGMGGMSNGAANLFISNDNLKKGKTYTIFVNGKKIGKVKMESPVTTLGNVFSMGGRGGW